ncbi:MAG: glucosamine-6-phosphate deaminase [Chitinophagaceae bacterium]
MDIAVFSTPALVAQATANKILAFIQSKPNALLCLAGGDSPRLTYQYLAAAVKSSGTNCGRLQFVSLDEWVGIPPTNTGSCFYFLQETIFGPLAIPPVNIHFFNSSATDLTAECNRIDKIIAQLQGIDVLLAGIGLNGHIGFNEPGLPQASAHVTELDSLTQQVGQKYFEQNASLQYGITQGMAQLLQSKTILLLATGTKKAAIVQQALEEKMTDAVPASLLRQHSNAFALLDREAAALLTQ